MEPRVPPLSRGLLWLPCPGEPPLGLLQKAGLGHSPGCSLPREGGRRPLPCSVPSALPPPPHPGTALGRASARLWSGDCAGRREGGDRGGARYKSGRWHRSRAPAPCAAGSRAPGAGTPGGRPGGGGGGGGAGSFPSPRSPGTQPAKAAWRRRAAGHGYRGALGSQRDLVGSGQRVGMPRVRCQRLGRPGRGAQAPGCLAGPPVLRRAHVARAGGELAGHLRHLPPQAHADGDQLLHRQPGGHGRHLPAVLRPLHGAALSAARLGAGRLHVQIRQLHPAGVSASHMRHLDGHERGPLVRDCLPAARPAPPHPAPGPGRQPQHLGGGLAPTAARPFPAAPWSAPSRSTTCWLSTCCPCSLPAPATVPCCATWAELLCAPRPLTAPCRDSCWHSAPERCAPRSPGWWPLWSCSSPPAGARSSCSWCSKPWAPRGPGTLAATPPTRSRSGLTACPTATRHSIRCSTPSWAHTSDRPSAECARAAPDDASAGPSALHSPTEPRPTQRRTAWPGNRLASGRRSLGTLQRARHASCVNRLLHAELIPPGTIQPVFSS